MKQCFQKKHSACKEDLGSWCQLLLFFILSLTPQLWAVTQTVILLSLSSPLGKRSFLCPRLLPSRLWQGPGSWNSSLSILCGFGPRLSYEWKWLSSGRLGPSGVHGISPAAQNQCRGHRGWSLEYPSIHLYPYQQESHAQSFSVP